MNAKLMGLVLAKVLHFQKILYTSSILLHNFDLMMKIDLRMQYWTHPVGGGRV